MMQVFERLDIFGKPVLFNFGKDSKSKSKVGAIFTLGFLGFVIWVVYYFGKEIIQKKNPSVASSQGFRENPGEIFFNTDDTFVFNFGIQNKQTVKPFMNASIFTFQASLFKTKTTPQDDGTSLVESENIPLDLEPCTKSYFGELGESFSYYELSSMYCLSKKQPNLEKAISVLGKPESETFQALQIMGFLCDPSTSAVPCGSDQEIRDALGFFQLQYSNVAVDPMNYENPVTRFRDSYFTSTAANSTKEVDLWISPMQMKTDDGWLTNSYTTENYVQPTKVAEFLSERSDRDPFFYSFLQAGGITTQYTRSYIKVQDIAARVNGIISFSLIMLIILVTPYVRLKFYEELIHDVFDVTMLRDSKGKMKRSKTKRPSKGAEPMAKPAQVLAKEISQTHKCGSKTKEEDAPPKKQPEIQLKIIDDQKKETETIFQFSENLLSSPRAESETKVQQKHQNLLSVQRTESLEKKPEYLLSVEDQISPTSMQESPRGKNPLKKSAYGSPTLLEMKPDLTKPTFKTLMGDGGDTHDAFEDFLVEIAINQQEEVENQGGNNKVQIPWTERAGFVEEGDQTKRDQQDNPGNPGDPGDPGDSGSSPPAPRKQEEVRIPIRKSPTLYLHSSDQINLTFWEYLRSFVCPNEVIKEKMDILNEGIRRINERLDIFNLLKKLREVDKLKILMLEDDQYILFEGLPKPEIMKETGMRGSNHSIKNAKFIQEKVKNDLVFSSYQNLKSKKDENLIDRKLLRIFDEILVD